MAHEDVAEGIARLLWAGNYRKAVETLRPGFLADPDENLVAWISALYSARFMPSYRQELLKTYILTALRRASSPIETFSDDALRMLDVVDVLTTVFEWASRTKHSSVSGTLSKRYRECTRRMLREAEPYLTPEHVPQGHHVMALLRLTRAHLHFQEGRPGEALMDVYEAVRLASSVKDPRQRERIYRKAGILFRLLGKKGMARQYGFQALLIFHLSPGVKLKSIAALFGIDL
ncbi:MAG: hypothetical protein P4M11_07315 [Candidatus Pacebacteria bacterium]|nr:hypothetical protein [Candidatus Paceibacterota bacterium]